MKAQVIIFFDGDEHYLQPLVDSLKLKFDKASVVKAIITRPLPIVTQPTVSVKPLVRTAEGLGEREKV